MSGADGRERYRRLDALLDELFEAEAAARAARLAEIRGEDAELAAELEALLGADAAADDFLARPLEAAVTTWISERDRDDASSGEAGATIGAWRLVAPLGKGGMGEVWEVERADGAYELRAALKLLKRGLDSDAIVARFRAERQILARLDHPAIARLLDGGVAEDGRPYYVMELVRGRPITEAAAALGLGVAERLGRMVVVCDAVEAAHRALVVHRDLKPANLLLTDAGEPKLLDFGIAKLLVEDAGAAQTRIDERILTPAYAAPEQIVGGAVTTATDVYALGVVLYELLTGELPHQRAVTSAAELAAAVERETIERPSAAVARRAAGSGRRGERAIAQPRAEQLRGDLDAVVLRALAREPARRYPSAAALGDDLRRHLEGRPVAARPDSFGYVASRFVRRHRLAVGATALVALSLVGGFGAALVSAERARREAARAEAESARARAEGERAKRMKDFLISVFQEASPMQRARGTPLSIEELLDAAEGRIDAELAAEPLLQADLWDDLAETRASGGNLEAASQLIDKALAAKHAHLAPDDLSLVESLVNRGAIWNLLSTAVRRSLAAGRVGSEDERAALEAELKRRAELGLAALDEAQAILERRGEGDSEPAVNVAVNRVHALLVLDRDEEGAAASERAAELTDRWRSGSPDAAMQHHNSGLVAVRQGRNEDAKRHFLAAIERLEKLLGPDHALVSLPVLGLADLYENRLGDVAGAIPYYERALAIVERHYPEGNPERVERETDLREARAKLGR